MTIALQTILFPSSETAATTERTKRCWMESLSLVAAFSSVASAAYLLFTCFAA